MSAAQSFRFASTVLPVGLARRPPRRRMLYTTYLVYSDSPVLGASFTAL
jgi:hypothetical protein